VSEARSISVQEAKQLIEEGYVYVDVRSEPEYEQAHVPGAINIPLNHSGPPNQGMVANPDFVSVMERAFPKNAKLVLGCKSGARSKRAMALLEQVGFTELVELGPGFEGSRDAFGRPVKGWIGEGLPTESGNSNGQSYADVKRRAEAKP
jgi:rhodanese-related sulfurtransferase